MGGVSALVLSGPSVGRRPLRGRAPTDRDAHVIHSTSARRSRIGKLEIDKAERSAPTGAPCWTCLDLETRPAPGHATS